jgi:G3E family GTPase
LIESTGVGEPIPVAQTFSYIDEEHGIDLTKFCRLDCMVTVVDAYRFWSDFSSGERLMDRKQEIGENDTREVVDLLIDQIEFCDVLILNKCDRVGEKELEDLETVLRSLQPRAKIIRSEFGRIEASDILNTGLFDFDEASRSAGWMLEMAKEHHVPETEEYGISSFVYERIRPFHPERLMQWMSEWPTEVVRAKGMIWLATRNDMAQNFSQAGPSIQFGPAGYWVASLPRQEREDIVREDPSVAEYWDPVYGDRVNKVVFIGLEMDRNGLTAELDDCLLTEEEMGMEWSSFPDEFPNQSSVQFEEQLLT